MSAPSDPVSRPAPRADASMRLLREVMEQPLDPAYALAAGLRASGRRPRRAAAALTVAVAVLCGWVVTRGIAELRRPEPGLSSGRATLEREIERREAAADARQRQIQQLRAEIAAAQQAQLMSQGDAALAAQVQELALLTGEVPVTGPGLEITLNDAKSSSADSAVVDPRAAAGSDDGRVLDRDLQIVVNGLWAAGAEAIAINGRRLTALSAIRSAGQAILVDFRALVPPYRVQAIGDPTGLQSRFSQGSAASYLQSLRDNFAVQVSITSATAMRLPAAGAFQLHRAGTPPTASPASPGSGTAPVPGTPSASTGSPAAPASPGSPAGGSAAATPTSTEVRS